MSDRVTPVLGDKNIYPTEDLIRSIIGDKINLWQSIMDYAHAKHSGIVEEWRFYNDGKQWLFKLTQKKKTIFWLSILKDTFRITFYFGPKAEPVIMGSELSQNIKDEFLAAQKSGSLRGITTVVSGPADADKICKLIDIKIKIK